MSSTENFAFLREHKMARQLSVSIYEYRAIFGDSDEDSGDVDGSDSDIDFEGIDEDAEESDGDNDQTGNEGASDSDEELEEEWWTAELRDIDVNKFTAQSGISISLTLKPITFLHSCLVRISSRKSSWRWTDMLVKNWPIMNSVLVDGET